MEKIKFITAVPQAYRFLWEMQILHYNMQSLGIDLSNSYVAVAYKERIDEAFLKYAAATKANIVFIRDECPRDYLPTIRPFLIAGLFERRQELTKETYCFYHDTDIAFTKKPDLSPFLKGEGIAYLSDTISYIGYKYLKSKGSKIIDDMAKVVGIPVSVIKENEQGSGGAQYLYKGVDETYWRKVAKDCEALYAVIKEIEPYKEDFLAANGEELTKDNMIQAWTAGMWAELWNLWYFGINTSVHKYFDFAWATSPYLHIDKKLIYHNAGITRETKKDHFYKADYNLRSPFFDDFTHVTSAHADKWYVDLFKPTSKWLMKIGAITNPND